MYSLWKVYDNHTNALMQDFYTGVLEGSSYSAALRNAKRRLIGNPTTAFPSKWAGFVLLGSSHAEPFPHTMSLLHEELPDAK